MPDQLQLTSIQVTFDPAYSPQERQDAWEVIARLNGVAGVDKSQYTVYILPGDWTTVTSVVDRIRALPSILCAHVHV